MIKEPSKIVAARAALEKAEENLAKKLFLTHRNKVLSEVKIIISII